MKKIFIQKIFLLKLSAFFFKLVVFPLLVVVTTMWHPKHGTVLLYRCGSRIFRR